MPGNRWCFDIQLNELEDFISAVDPEGIMLCIAADEDIKPDIIKRSENGSRNIRKSTTCLTPAIILTEFSTLGL